MHELMHCIGASPTSGGHTSDRRRQPRGHPMKVDQTILHDDPERHGNCFAACVATAVGKPLSAVPHFVEWGQWLHNEKRKDSVDADRKCWWAMFLGYVAALGLFPEVLDSPDDAEPEELVFVSGPSPRGIPHHVLYRDGRLWHDPHPSKAGILFIDTDDVIYVLRPIPEAGHDHNPTVREAGKETDQ